MPGWAHDITNVGDSDMVVMLWANEVFDRQRPDTYACHAMTLKKLKVMTVVGTRPEIIRLSRVIAALERSTRPRARPHRSEPRLRAERDLLRGPRPAARRATTWTPSGETAAQTIGNVIARTDALLEQEQPDAFLVLGDTNSCLAAIPAKKRRVPVFHMEAGNRCFDQRVPEETNRRIVDHIADVNLTYSDIAREYLLREGFPPDRLIKTGSPMFEVLTHYRAAHRGIRGAASVSACAPRDYFVVSAHREENVDSPARLTALFGAVNADRASVRQADHRVDPSADPEAARGGAARSSMRGSNCSKPLGFLDYIRCR